MTSRPHPFGSDRLVEAYDRMLERLEKRWHEAEDRTLPTLNRQIEHARETAVELNELTREEANRISDYLLRDLEEAARFVTQTGQDFRDWFRFDLELIEQRLLDMFGLMVDQTRVELDRLEERAHGIIELHTGEVAGAGTLYCRGCDAELQFHKTGRIPPCPKCHGTAFRRIQPDEVVDADGDDTTGG